MHLQLLVTHASGVGSLRFSRTEVSSCSLQGSCVERWCWQPTLIIFDLKLVPRIQSASLGGGSPGPFPACCELIRKPIENVMKSNMKTECMSSPIGSAKQINGIKSIVRKAPPKAGNDFLVKVKVAVAVRYFGLLLSSASSTGQIIIAAQPETKNVFLNVQKCTCLDNYVTAAACFGARETLKHPNRHVLVSDSS